MITQDLGKAGITANSTWDISQAYERNSIVFNMLDNTSYLSRRDVPAGADINDVYYWQPFAGLSIDDGSVSVDKLAPDVKDLIYASFPVDTTSGDIASFEDGADNVPVRELKLNLEPYQNLNGYDSPWVGGAGTNLYNSKGLVSYSSQGVTVTESNGTLTFNGTATGTGYFVHSFNLPVGNYRFALHNTETSSLRVSFQDLDNNYFLDTTIDAVGKILAITNRSIKRLIFYVTSGLVLTNYAVKPQLEKGSTATSWTPYENICPIYPSNGKNLLENVVTDDVKTIGGITYTKLSDGSVIANGTATSASFYCPDVSTASATPVTDHNMFLDAYMGKTLVVTGTPRDVGSANIRIMIGRQAGSSLANDIGSGATFTVSEAGLWVGIRIESGTTVNNAHFYPMIRPVEITDSAYVPYNAIGITRTGKNFFNKNDGLFGLWESGGQVYSSTNAYSAIVRCFPNTTYSISKIATSRFRISSVSQYPKDGVSGTSLNANDSATQLQVTTGNDAQYLLIYCYYAPSDGSIGMANVINSLQVEVGSSATQYEPYTAERYYSISDNPVYGGTLEVETGVLTVTKGYAVINGSSSESWGWHSGRNSPYVGVSGGIVTDAVTQYNIYVNSDKFKPVSWASTGSEDYCVGMYYGASFVLFKNTSIFTDLATAKTWFANNPTQVTYELATPQTYQLSPTQVKTLLGYNNIWTDSGTVEVQYLANIGLYIQKIIGATEDDMVANQNISANKYFFVGETLYYSTSAISAGQTIVVGTNCIKTNLADALNALNS